MSVPLSASKERNLSAAILQSPLAGELFAANISIRLRLLEDLLECLAQASFPINPELEHDTLRGMSLVSFPVYEEQLGELGDLLQANGFALSVLTVKPMHEELALECARGDYERGL
jgi:hypothetical protein